MTKILTSVAVLKDNGDYVTTVSWDEKFQAHKQEPGINRTSRIPELDCYSAEGIGYFVTAILKGDPLGTLEFLWL